MLESLYAFWYRLRSWFRRTALDAELAEELQLHAELLEEEARRAGASADDARRIAAARLGNRTAIRERTAERWSFGFIDAVLQDTRYALRFLRRSPGFTAVAVLSLALGIGVNAAVFTVADRLLFSAPAHVAKADQLYALNVRRVTEHRQDAPFWPAMWFSEYFALQEQATSFAAMAVYTPPDRERLGRGPDAPRIKESMVSTNFFDVLGTRPARGRFFLPDDDRSDRADNAAVISYGFWQRHFGGADSAVGAHFTTSHLDFVVVGIAPGKFTGVDMDAADVWVPLGAAAPTRIKRNWKEWTGNVPHVVARLKERVGPATAGAEATVILGRLPEVRRFGKTEETVALGSVIEARGPAEQSGEVKVSTRLVLASGLVLLAACANLANLLLVRALTRRREIALRLAIGVSRRRLVGQMLLESLVMALAGSMVALVAARWGGAALRALVFPELQWASGTVDLRVFLFSVACGTMVAMIATIAPAVRMTRADVGTALRSAAPQLTTSTGRLRQALIALQVALSVLLIVGATAFSQSLRRAYDFDMGVDLDRILTTRFSVESDSLPAPERLAMLEEAARRVQRVPGVARASVAAALPLLGNTNVGISIPERTLPERTFAAIWWMTPELQQTVGFRVVRGRSIAPEDVAPGMPASVVVSETMAHRLWPGTDAVGKCVRIGDSSRPCMQVIGVIRDLRQYSFREEAPMSMLVSSAKPNLGENFTGYVIIRVADGIDPATLVSPVRTVMKAMRADLASLDVRPLAQALELDYRPLRLGAAAFGGFAIIAMILAAVGLYGILAFSVAVRTSELGIRAALGARARDIVTNVVQEGLAVVFVGLAAGVALSLYASTTIASLLFESSARDPSPYLYATGVLVIVALAAAAVPAWRATRVDPATALRSE